VCSTPAVGSTGRFRVLRTQADAPWPVAAVGASTHAAVTVAAADADDWGAAGAWGDDVGDGDATAAEEPVLTATSSAAVPTPSLFLAPVTTAARPPVILPVTVLDTVEEGWEEESAVAGGGAGVVDTESDSEPEAGSGTRESGGVGAGVDRGAAGHAKLGWGAGWASSVVSGTAMGDDGRAADLLRRYMAEGGTLDGVEAPVSSAVAPLPLHAELAGEADSGDSSGEDGETAGGGVGGSGAGVPAASPEPAVRDSGSSTGGGDGGRRRARGGRRRKHDGASGSGGGGGGGDGGVERYEKTPAKVRWLLAFQRRLAWAPGQCVRYAFGDEPLWPVPPGPLRCLPAAVPRCPCGARRLFECQVMPPLIAAAGVDDHVVTAVPTTPPAVPATGPSSRDGGVGSRSAASAPLAASSSLLPGGGVDFLTLCVYSCEVSCDRPGSAEEWVWAVPSMLA